MLEAAYLEYLFNLFILDLLRHALSYLFTRSSRNFLRAHTRQTRRLSNDSSLNAFKKESLADTLRYQITNEAPGDKFGSLFNSFFSTTQNEIPVNKTRSFFFQATNGVAHQERELLERLSLRDSVVSRPNINPNQFFFVTKTNYVSARA